MFEEKSNKRKFQCYVCGVMFTEFNEFTEHIIKEHEEGRDYVFCPLQRCKTPVRDVTSHFRLFHPQEKIPKIGQLKALVWRDISAQGKVKTKKPAFKQGYYESTKMNKAFLYRSGWEATVFELLDSWNEVVAFEAEPFDIPYIHEGTCHKYKPDIFIAFLDGRKAVWEVKPSNQTYLEKNQDKWFSARKACEARDWEFTVITEQVIEKLKKTVKNQHLQNYDDDIEMPDEEY